MNDDRATIIAKVRGWINPKLQIEDVSNPDLSPNDVVIHVKGKTDADYFGYQSDVHLLSPFLRIVILCQFLHIFILSNLMPQDLQFYHTNTKQFLQMK